jgi:hypothetical protein
MAITLLAATGLHMSDWSGSVQSPVCTVCVDQSPVCRPVARVETSRSVVDQSLVCRPVARG